MHQCDPVAVGLVCDNLTQRPRWLGRKRARAALQHPLSQQPAIHPILVSPIVETALDLDARHATTLRRLP